MYIASNLAGQLLYGLLTFLFGGIVLTTPPPSTLCGDGTVRPVHIMPADRWVCPINVDVAEGASRWPPAARQPAASSGAGVDGAGLG